MHNWKHDATTTSYQTTTSQIDTLAQIEQPITSKQLYKW